MAVEEATRAWVNRTPSRWFSTTLVQDGDNLLVASHQGSRVLMLWVDEYAARPVPVEEILPKPESKKAVPPPRPSPVASPASPS